MTRLAVRLTPGTEPSSGIQDAECSAAIRAFTDARPPPESVHSAIILLRTIYLCCAADSPEAVNLSNSLLQKLFGDVFDRFPGLDGVESPGTNEARLVFCTDLLNRHEELRIPRGQVRSLASDLGLDLNELPE